MVYVVIFSKFTVEHCDHRNKEAHKQTNIDNKEDDKERYAKVLPVFTLTHVVEVKLTE